MTKNKLISWAITILILLGLIAFIYNKYSTKTSEAQKFIDNIKEENRFGFDSLQNAINRENDLNYRIKENINVNNFKAAYALMDSLPSFGQNATIHLYKGMIYAEQKNYPLAISEYNISIREECFPIALNKRAEAYIKLNKLDSAIADYKKSYSWNYDHSLQVATTFERMNKKDSALKYYKIYLKHYPNDSTALQKKDLLISQKK